MILKLLKNFIKVLLEYKFEKSAIEYKVQSYFLYKN